MKQCKLLFLGFMLILLGGCTTASVQNMHNQAVPNDVKSLTQVRNAILAGGKDRGWTMHAVKQSKKAGLIEGTYRQNGNVAVVNIPYTKHGYSIVRKDTAGFEYDAKKKRIRRHYNWWVGYLNDSIQVALVESVYKQKS